MKFYTLLENFVKYRCTLIALGVLAALPTLSTSFELRRDQALAVCTGMSLRLFYVDDTLDAYLTNSAFDSQLILSAGYGQDTGLVDISSQTRPGSNTLTLQLTNTQRGYTYVYELRSGSATIAQETCFTAGIYRCDNNDFTLGIVFTHTLSFLVSGRDSDRANRFNLWSLWYISATRPAVSLSQ